MYEVQYLMFVCLTLSINIIIIMSNTESVKKLYVKLINSERPFKPSKVFTTLYFSFKFLNLQYFSSCITAQDVEGRNPPQINDHFVFPFDNVVEEGQLLQVIRWENHEPVFTFGIELSEILGKQYCRKRLESKPQEYLNLTISVLQDQEVNFLDRKTNEIAHYFCIDSIDFKLGQRGRPNKQNIQPSYISIIAGKKQYILPESIESKCVILQLPEKLMFQYFFNDGLLAKSEVFHSDDLLKKSTKVSLSSEEGKIGMLTFEGRWGYNLSNQNEFNIMADINQLSLYDFQVIFDKDNQYPDSKLKITYGNKLYELTHDTFNGKKMRYRKLLTLLLKPEDEQITFRLQKNHIEFCNLKVLTDELHQCESIKKKLSDINNGKQMGTLRFRSQKARTLSLPQNNRLWRQLSRKKMKCNYVLSIEQVSYYVVENDELLTLKPNLLFTVGNFKTQFDGVVCLSTYDLDNAKRLAAQTPIQFQIREQNAIYLTFERDIESVDEDNVEGMAVVDIAELRLGMNAIEAPIYRNQKLVSHVNLLLNKIPNFQIVKAGYQPQIVTRKKKTRGVSVDVSSTLLNGYFYTYEYENKNDLYCIVEINRIKKVLLLNRQSADGLSFIQGEGSDYLNFTVEQSENLRVKLTLLIADLGAEEEIYGTVVFKCRFHDLVTGGSIMFSRTSIKNDHEVVVGSASVTVNIGDSIFKKSPTQINEVQTANVEVEKAVRRPRAQRSVDVGSSKNLSLNNGSVRYSSIDAKELQHSEQFYNNNSLRVIKEISSPRTSIKLPPLPSRAIKQQQYDNVSIKTLIQRAKKQQITRKDKGELAMDDTITRLQKEVQMNRNKFRLMNRASYKVKNQVSSDKLAVRMPLNGDVSNPNIEKNFEILFPNRAGRVKKTQIKEKINEYDEKLKGLKSVLDEINKDIQSVEPQFHEKKPKKAEPVSLAQFQDNEFISGADQKPISKANQVAP